MSSLESNSQFIDMERFDTQPAWGGFGGARIDECRRLVTERYLGEGYIGTNDLEPDTGLMNSQVDPYYKHSEYFWATDSFGNVEATIRLIHHPGGNNSGWLFPMQREFDIDPVNEQLIQRNIADNQAAVVEISGLAERKGADGFVALDMYRRMWQHSMASGYDVCLISADIRLYNKLKSMFGEAVTGVGDSKMVMGSQTVPAILQPRNCAGAMASIYDEMILAIGHGAADNYKELVLYLMDGLPYYQYNNDEKQQLARMGIMVD